MNETDLANEATAALRQLVGVADVQAQLGEELLTIRGRLDRETLALDAIELARLARGGAQEFLRGQSLPLAPSGGLGARRRHHISRMQ